MANEAGKGSKQRPKAVSDQEWSNRWDAIFGKDENSEHYLATQADNTEEEHEVSSRRDEVSEEH